MVFSLLELELKKDESWVTVACFGYRSLLYIEWGNDGLSQLDLFWMKVYLNKKWK